MSSTKADAALERLVLSLSAATDEEIQGVLARLDLRERETLRNLFEKYGRALPAREEAPPAPKRDNEPKAEFDVSGISAWLAARIVNQADARSPDGAAFRISSTSLAALREVAAERASERAAPGQTSSGWRLFKKSKRGPAEDART